DRPRSGILLVSCREHDRKTGLRIDPVILKNISVDGDPPRILQFQQVFDCPVAAEIRRITNLPTQRFEKKIAANLDIRRHEVLYLRIGASEHDVFGGGFKVVIDDVKGSGSVPATNCLRVGGDSVDIGDVRVDDGSFRTVEADAALKLL